MLRGIGPRFYVEAGFLIVVAAVLAIERVRPSEIVLVMLGAYLAVFSVELVLARRRTAVAPAPARPVDEPASPVAEPEPEVEAEREAEPSSAIVVVRPVEPREEPVAADASAAEQSAGEEPADEEPATEWIDDPERRPVVLAPESTPEPAVEAEPIVEPEAPIAPTVLTAVPEPEPEPAREPEPEPVVVAAAFPQQPRAWNLWELERLVRSGAGEDPTRDEELSFLLVYLRDFASPEGLLPEDFDELVRESFGDVLEAAAAR